MIGTPDVVQPWMRRAARDSDACLWHVSIVGGARRRGCAAGGVATILQPVPRLNGMCPNIRQLHNFEPPATADEVNDAALQYVRKISGSTKPSQANQEAFEQAVAEVAAATQRLLDHLVTTAPPKNREEEAAKARARAQARYAA